MTRFRAAYGAGLVHAAGMLLALALAGFAIDGWFVDAPGDVVRILAWFLGAIVAHDLVFLPLVQLLNRALFGAQGRAKDGGRFAKLAGIRNHIRIPSMLSGLLLLVFAPLILRASRSDYHTASALSPDPFLRRWLLITAGLFAVSGVVWLLQQGLRRR